MRRQGLAARAATVATPGLHLHMHPIPHIHQPAFVQHFVAAQLGARAVLAGALEHIALALAFDPGRDGLALKLDRKSVV